MHGIHDAELHRIDLNLLVAFDAIVSERSVTRAASRCGVTQSAMSHSLRRLRDLLADPLLVRGQAGLVLTPRAETLAPQIRAGLATLGRAMGEGPTFEARTSERRFTLASVDVFELLLVPPLLAHLRDAAPGVDLRFLPGVDPRLGERLETGDIGASKASPP